MDPEQFRHHILRPVLKQIELWSPEAEELLMGTAAVESGFRYLHQIRGPAVGIFQMEPKSIMDLLGWIGQRPRAKASLIPYTLPQLPIVEQCHGNLYLITALARWYYYRIPDPIPVKLAGQAEYWKRYYNTPLGKGTEQKYISAYNRLIKGAS